MTPDEFIAKWSASELKESQASQSHFNDLCRMLDEPTPAEADPTGESYCFERGAKKDSGGDGWADVWKRNHFAWEYKGPHANLDTAFRQLRQYALALENPPLLIVCDLQRFRIRTNWTNSVSLTHEFGLEDLRDTATRNKLKWALSDPERLRPGETRQEITERAAQRFATLAQSLRDRGSAPQAVAHFVNRLVFCMFAEDVGLLPNKLFTRMLDQARQQPREFPDLARDLFGAMSVGGRVGFESVAWFDGGLFDDDSALPLTRAEIETVRNAGALDWTEVDPSILGTLFERGLDPGKRTQLGAHYTDRDKIMLIVEPVIIRPWLAEWETTKNLISAELDYAEAARRRRPSRIRHSGESTLHSGGPLRHSFAKAGIQMLRCARWLEVVHRRKRPNRCLGGMQRSPVQAPKRPAAGTAPSGYCMTSWSGCAPSPSSIPPAARATSSTWRSRRSRTWSTGCSWKARRWVWTASSPPSGRPT